MGFWLRFLKFSGNTGNPIQLKGEFVGCDIHSIAQFRHSIDKEYWFTERADVAGDKRNYDTFAILANVRNGYGFAGVETGEIGQTLKLNVDARTAQAAGAELDADTVYWWLSQSKEAIDSIIAQPQESISSALDQLNVFLAPATAVWSHATFDFVILKEAYRRMGIKTKFHYRTARDIRTLVDLSGINTTDPNLVRTGTNHDALDDCIFQIKYCVMAFQKLKSKSAMEHKL